MQGDAEPEEGQEPVAAGVASPMDAMLMAKAIEHLTKASRHDAELITKIREQARKEVQDGVRTKIKALGTMQELKELSDEELARRIADLAETAAA